MYSSLLNDVVGDALDVATGADKIPGFAEMLVEPGETIATYAPGKFDTVFFLSVALDTTTDGFVAHVEPDRQTTEVIREWLIRSKTSSAPIIEVPFKLDLEDSQTRRRSTNFGILVADIMRRESSNDPADLGLMSGGTFRLDRDISAHETLTERTLRDIFYYDNRVLEYALSGRDILSILSAANCRQTGSASPTDEADGEFVQVAGLTISSAAGQPVTRDAVRCPGQATKLDDGARYRVVTTNYLAQTSPVYRDFFASAEPREVAPNLRDLVGSALRRLTPADWSSLRARTDGWRRP